MSNNRNSRNNNRQSGQGQVRNTQPQQQVSKEKITKDAMGFAYGLIMRIPFFRRNPRLYWVAFLVTGMLMAVTLWWFTPALENVRDDFWGNSKYEQQIQDLDTKVKEQEQVITEQKQEINTKDVIIQDKDKDIQSEKEKNDKLQEQIQSLIHILIETTTNKNTH